MRHCRDFIIMPLRTDCRDDDRLFFFRSLSVIRSGCLSTVSRNNDAHQRFQRLILQQPTCVFHGLFRVLLEFMEMIIIQL
jgi:hypothetical protein